MASGKVDKVDGKGLSTNDFTNLDKNTYDAHIVNINNPHAVTPVQIGAATAEQGAKADTALQDALLNRVNFASTDGWTLVNHMYGAYRLAVSIPSSKVAVGVYISDRIPRGFCDGVYVYANEPFAGFVKIG